MKNIILGASIILLAGCARTGSETAKNDDGYKCEKVYSISSNIPKRVCNNRAQREEIKEKSKEELRKIQNGGRDPYTG